MTSANRPLPEPMLTKSHVAMWRYGAKLRSTYGDMNSSPLDKYPSRKRCFRLQGNDVFSCNLCILIKISLKFVPKVPIYRRISDKPLSGPMLTRYTDAYMGYYLSNNEYCELCYRWRLGNYKVNIKTDICKLFVIAVTGRDVNVLYNGSTLKYTDSGAKFK